MNNRALIISLLGLILFGLQSCDNANNPSGNGVSNGGFSVAPDKQVHFSQGNLQYQASTNTWRFAEQQYDIIGEANSNISTSYDGWIDLFGWGTGNNPTNTSSHSEDYSSFIDWGVNAISNGGNIANQWRTLTADEWYYLGYKRPKAATLFGLGCVNGVNGAILLPDNWKTPNGVSFSPGAKNWSNFYSIAQWQIMELAGAVFLPAAGVRLSVIGVTDVGLKGYYWSATYDYEDRVACYLSVCSWGLGYEGGGFDGKSVRLVH